MNSAALKTSGSPPQINPGEITILIATRARPQMLAEVFQSLKANTTDRQKVSIRLYVDADDQVTRQAIESRQIPDPGIPVHWHFGEQTMALGETHEVLWKSSGRTAQIYMISVDDARFDTPGWDKITRAAFNQVADGVLLAFPHDPMTSDTATYPIFGYGWLNTLQQIFPGHFPYWFDDHWVSQVGALAGRCIKLPILFYPIRGKGRTKRMRNVPFWARFFQLTLPERKAAARKLIDAINPADEKQHVAALATLEHVAAGFCKEEDRFSDIYCAFQEERHAEPSIEEREQFDPKYFKHEAAAVARLIEFARGFIAEKKFDDAMKYLDATQLSDLRVKQAQVLKAECLRGLGKDAEANRVLQESLAAWPQMTTLRKGFRFLGMVANDVKRMLVGMTEKGRQGKK